MNNILITGGNGLVGSRLIETYEKTFHFHQIDLNHPKNPVDITNYQQLANFINNHQAKYLVHFAAYTNVNGAWQQRGNKQGLAYQVNVKGTENIVNICQQNNIHLIHISTAYVFDGKKKSAYNENDQPNPIEWYGKTKYLAEQIVQNSDLDWTILRIDQPFRNDPFKKLDIAHRIIKSIQTKTLPPQFINHYIGPTYIEDLCKVIIFMIKNHHTGLYHATSGETWTDYDFANSISQIHQLNYEIKKGDLTEYLKNQTRPYQKNTALDCSKLKQVLDFSLKPIKQAIKDIKY